MCKTPVDESPSPISANDKRTYVQRHPSTFARRVKNLSAVHKNYSSVAVKIVKQN